MATDPSVFDRDRQANTGVSLSGDEAINRCPMEHYCVNTSSVRSSFGPLKTALLCLAAGVVLTGCAGTAPVEQYAVSRSAVNAAVSAGGTEFAAVEMKSAQDKLKDAEIALHGKDYDDARRLAEQAEWDARVAERKAQAAKARRAVEDARQGVKDLREEGLRAAS
jgi:hypothetical protein